MIKETLRKLMDKHCTSYTASSKNHEAILDDMTTTLKKITIEDLVAFEEKLLGITKTPVETMEEIETAYAKFETDSKELLDCKDKIVDRTFAYGDDEIQDKNLK